MHFVYGSILDDDQDYQLELAKQYIAEYCEDEFEDEAPDFGDLENIGLACGGIDNEELGVYDAEVQTIADLVHYTIKSYVDGILVETRQFKDLKDMNDNYLRYLDWSLCAYPNISDDAWNDIFEQSVEWRKEARLANKKDSGNVTSAVKITAKVDRKSKKSSSQLKEDLKDLLSADSDLMYDVVNAIYSETGEFDTEVFIESKEFFETLTNEKPEDIVLKFYNGKDLDSKGQANPNREYFRLNKYENVESTNYPGDLYVDRILDDVCDYITKNTVEFTYPDEVQVLLEKEPDIDRKLR